MSALESTAATASAPNPLTGDDDESTPARAPYRFGDYTRAAIAAARPAVTDAAAAAGNAVAPLADTAALGGQANRGASGARKYRFGDLTRGVLAAGRVARGGDADRGGYRFGDATRGVVASVRGDADVADARLAAAATRDSSRAGRAAVSAHLEEFLAEDNPATYEEWIAVLHPENVVDGEGNIDSRFYHESSDHREIWNARCPRGATVAARPEPRSVEL